MSSKNQDQFEDVNSEMAVRCSCDICMEAFESKVHVPRVVKCGHSTCQKCIKKLIDKNKNYKCPFCSTVTNVPSIEALPINRSLIDIVDYVRNEGQRAPKEETGTSYFCAHRSCSGGVRSLKEMAVCRTDSCVQLSALRAKSRSQLNEMNVEAIKKMREVYTLIDRTNGLREEMWQHVKNNDRTKDLVDRSEKVHSEKEAKELQKSGHELMKPYLDSFSRWKAALTKIKDEMEGLFGSEEVATSPNEKNSSSRSESRGATLEQLERDRVMAELVSNVEKVWRK